MQLIDIRIKDKPEAKTEKANGWEKLQAFKKLAVEEKEQNLTSMCIISFRKSQRIKLEVMSYFTLFHSSINANLSVIY